MKNITIQTGVARLSYAHIFEPRPNQGRTLHGCVD